MRRRGWFSFGPFYMALLIASLYLPILLLIVFSFNDSPLMVFPLKGFTLKWYAALLQATELLKAVRNSIVLGLAASLASTVLGTMAAVGLVRGEVTFAGQPTEPAK